MSSEASARFVKYPTDAEIQVEFEAYTCAVGKVAHTWNYLHERLGNLFAESHQCTRPQSDCGRLVFLVQRPRTAKYAGSCHHGVAGVAVGVGAVFGKAGPALASLSAQIT